MEGKCSWAGDLWDFLGGAWGGRGEGSFQRKEQTRLPGSEAARQCGSVDYCRLRGRWP